jgi:hypothetical protein
LSRIKARAAGGANVPGRHPFLENGTMRAATPFDLTGRAPGRLDHILQGWRDLRRGQATMPFADDLDLPKVETDVDDVFVLGVFESPVRFRFDVVRLPHWPSAQADLADRFLDEVASPAPLQLARAQADATVELGEPTLYQRPAGSDARAYARLMLPYWGEGHVKLLLGAVDWR